MLLETLATYYLIFTQPVINQNTVDLRPYFSRVFDQGKSNSCTAHAIASVANFHEKQTNKNSKLISRLDIYHQSRKNFKEDNGASFQNSMDVLEHNSLCDESFWPYTWRQVNSNPPTRCITNRKVHSNFKPFQLPSNSQCIAYAIRKNHPVVIGALLTKNFNESDTFVPLKNDPIVCKHAMVVVGVTTNDDQFIIRNSWSTNWKSNGYITVPRLFIDRFVVDSWILTPLD